MPDDDEEDDDALELELELATLPLELPETVDELAVEVAFAALSPPLQPA